MFDVYFLFCEISSIKVKYLTIDHLWDLINVGRQYYDSQYLIGKKEVGTDSEDEAEESWLDQSSSRVRRMFDQLSLSVST